MTQGLIENRTRLIFTAMAVLVACAFGFGLAQASTASAQLPAICEEYPNADVCDDDPTGGDNLGPSAGGDGTGESGGSLPFTGYPLSALIIFLLALLVAGLALRAFLAARSRLAGRDAT